MRTELGDLLDEQLAAAGYSLKTMRVYATALRAADAALTAGRGMTVDNVTAVALREYADTLPLTRSTRALLRSSLVCYWRLSQRTDGPVGAIRVPTRARMVSRALDEDVAARLAAAAAIRGDVPGLAVTVALYSGLRRAEIAALRWDAMADGWLSLVGKGDVSATIPLHPIVLAALAAWRTRNPSPFVFPGRQPGTHVNPTTIWTWTRRVADAAGLGPIPPHVLRHTALTTALDITRDLRAVQELARHADPVTTAGYTRVRRRRLLETVTAICYEEAAS